MCLEHIFTYTRQLVHMPVRTHAMVTGTALSKPPHRLLSFCREQLTLHASQTPRIHKAARRVIIRELCHDPVLEVHPVSDVHDLAAEHREECLLSRKLLFGYLEIIRLQDNHIRKLTNLQRPDVITGSDELRTLDSNRTQRRFS